MYQGRGFSALFGHKLLLAPLEVIGACFQGGMIFLNSLLTGGSAPGASCL